MRNHRCLIFLPNQAPPEQDLPNQTPPEQDYPEQAPPKQASSESVFSTIPPHSIRIIEKRDKVNK